MHAGRIEWRLAGAEGVNVDRMLAGREPVEIKLDENASAGFLQIDPADLLAAQVYHVGPSEEIGLGRGLGRLSEGGRRGNGKKRDGNAEGAKHVDLPGHPSRDQRAASRIVQSPL